MTDVVIYDEVADNDHCSYCGARLDIGPPNHICKEIIYGTAVTPTPFLPFDLPAPPKPPPAAFRPKKIWAEELLNAVEHGRSL
jgi:hypothetical protein